MTDRPAILPLKRSHIRACSAIVAGSEPWRSLGETIDFAAFIGRNRTGTRAYVCTVRNRVAGFLLFIPEPVFARGGYLRAIAVAPRYRGRGIGHALLDFAEERTASRAEYLYLCVSDFNRPARAFYRTCGYRKAGSLPGLIRPGTAELILWKRLLRGPS
jgi:ribosomal protein S18 acetylase RimI-like enzyme